jgi:integrase
MDEVIRPNRRIQTIDTYDMHVRVHLIPGLGEKRLNKLDVQTVRSFFNKLANSLCARFLVSAREAGDPYYAAYVLILVLGLRRGEALGLGWPEVDFASGVLTPAHGLQRIGKAARAGRSEVRGL